MKYEAMTSDYLDRRSSCFVWDSNEGGGDQYRNRKNDGMEIFVMDKLRVVKWARKKESQIVTFERV